MALNPSIGPKVVPAAPATANANYDYFDIAEGTGIQNFFASQSIASGGIVSYALTTDNTVYSGKITEKFIGALGWSKVSDIDYDVTFNLPKIIKGDLVVTVTQGVGGGAELRSISLFVNIFKVSGGTPTQIGSEKKTELTTSSVGGVKSFTKNLTISSGGRVHFKQGDILRLNIELWGRATSASSEIGYGVDPQDRNDTTDEAGIDPVILDADTTQLKLKVPFIIDI